MKASFDGVRRRLAESYNALAKTKLTPEQREIMLVMQQLLIGLLCMEDLSSQPEDCNCLIETIALIDP